MRVRGNGKDGELMGLERKQVAVLPQGSPEPALLPRQLPFPWCLPGYPTPVCASLRAFCSLSLQASPTFEVEQSAFPESAFLLCIRAGLAPKTCTTPFPHPSAFKKGFPAFWRREWLCFCLENMFYYSIILCVCECSGCLEPWPAGAR